MTLKGFWSEQKPWPPSACTLRAQPLQPRLPHAAGMLGLDKGCRLLGMECPVSPDPSPGLSPFLMAARASPPFSRTDGLSPLHVHSASCPWRGGRQACSGCPVRLSPSHTCVEQASHTCVEQATHTLTCSSLPLTTTLSCSCLSPFSLSAFFTASSSLMEDRAEERRGGASMPPEQVWPGTCPCWVYPRLSPCLSHSPHGVLAPGLCSP